jgi:hypothetical protein
MTANQQTEMQPKSRRTLLAGALGGLGAWAASMVGRATPTTAGEGDPIIIGQTNYGRGTHTQLQTNSNGAALTVTQLSSSNGIRGESTSGRAVVGVAGLDGTGIWGESPNYRGVYGRAVDSGIGVYGECRGHGYGVVGESLDGTGVHAIGRTAIVAEGYGLGMDVRGSYLAARFQMGVRFQSFLDIEHRSAEPEAPNPKRVRLFVRLNESSKQEVCVKFSGGAVAILATEP